MRSSEHSKNFSERANTCVPVFVFDLIIQFLTQHGEVQIQYFGKNLLMFSTSSRQLVADVCYTGYTKWMQKPNAENCEKIKHVK